jgi:hypothetical protein
MIGASFLYSDGEGYHFMDQGSYETVTLRTDLLGDDRLLLSDNVQVQIQKFNGNPIGIQLPQHVALTVGQTEPAFAEIPPAAGSPRTPHSTPDSKSKYRSSSRKARK